VRLVTPDLAVIDAAIEGDAALARMLGCEVAEGWAVFPQSIPRVRVAVAADPGSTRWGTRLFVVDDPRTLVGWGGFKGPPREGVVELGYAISPIRQGQGLATIAVGELLHEAFAAPEVQTVIAHTLAERGPSVRVLEKSGFAYDGDIADAGRATWRFRIERPPHSCG
jgi:ribosomal-protein-alanine N-acetyltransferase